MTDLYFEATREAEQLLFDACARLTEAGKFPAGTVLHGSVERSRDASRGDLTATHALRSAGAAGMPPAALATLLAAELRTGDGLVSGAAAAGPGFLNFHLSDAWYARVLAESLAAEAAAVASVQAPEELLRELTGSADPALAHREDNANPLYFIRYTEARIRTLCARMAAGETPDTAVPEDPQARALLRQLAAYPAAREEAGSVLRCAEKIAAAFYTLYTARYFREDEAAHRALLQGCGHILSICLAAADGAGETCSG